MIENRTVTETGEITPTVFVLDDDPGIREALLLLLEAAGYQSKGYSDAQSFLDAYDNQAGCLILDLTMPEVSGLELQQALSARGYTIPVIFLSGQGSIPQSVQAIKAGAFDFLEKPVDSHLLLERISAACTLDARQRAEAARLAALQSRFEQLSPREREILTQVVEGQTSKEIARLLGISHRTVEVYRARIMAKLQAQSVPELVSYQRFSHTGLKSPG
ncbi:MAG: response regulator [Gammaproteobacteria bacterium]